MRIAIYQPRASYYVGGGKVMPLQQAKYLAKDGYKVTVINTRVDDIIKAPVGGNSRYYLYFMSKKFQKKVEDFTCERCAATVKGTGYTNHCPNCLWSKHVDINPGDRAAVCGGLMKPDEIIVKGDSIEIIHRCQLCGYAKKNKLQEGDNMDELIRLMSVKS